MTLCLVIMPKGPVSPSEKRSKGRLGLRLQVSVKVQEATVGVVRYVFRSKSSSERAEVFVVQDASVNQPVSAVQEFAPLHVTLSN